MITDLPSDGWPLGEELGAKWDELEIPEDMKAKAQEYREKLIDQIVEQDDEVLSAYFEGTLPDEATVRRLIRKGTIARAFTPMVCGTAFKNKGVQPLLDAVAE